MKEKVSVIIPCYNVEKTILRCLKSVEKQTYGMDNLEVILVNDGSTDNTISYLRAFEDRYTENVYVIDLVQNRGPATARNAGLKMATGKYVSFIDSDDTIDKTAIEKMYEKAEEYQCDLVECAYKLIVNENQEIANRNGEDWYRDLTDINNRRWYIVHMPKLTLWGRLWNRKFLADHQLWLAEGWHLGEDVLFTGQAMFLLKNCYFINEQLYFYYSTNESISRPPVYNAEKSRSVVNACKMLIAALKERGLYEEAITNYKDELGWYYIGPGYFYTMDNVYREINYLRNSVSENFPDICKNKYLQILDEIHAEYMRHFKRR